MSSSEDDEREDNGAIGPLTVTVPANHPRTSNSTQRSTARRRSKRSHDTYKFRSILKTLNHLHSQSQAGRFTEEQLYQVQVDALLQVEVSVEGSTESSNSLAGVNPAVHPESQSSGMAPSSSSSANTSIRVITEPEDIWKDLPVSYPASHQPIYDLINHPKQLEIINRDTFPKLEVKVCLPESIIQLKPWDEPKGTFTKLVKDQLVDASLRETTESSGLSSISSPSQESSVQNKDDLVRRERSDDQQQQLTEIDLSKGPVEIQVKKDEEQQGAGHPHVAMEADLKLPSSQKLLVENKDSELLVPDSIDDQQQQSLDERNAKTQGLISKSKFPTEEDNKMDLVRKAEVEEISLASAIQPLIKKQLETDNKGAVEKTAENDAGAPRSPSHSVQALSEPGARHSLIEDIGIEEIPMVVGEVLPMPDQPHAVTDETTETSDADVKIPSSQKLLVENKDGELVVPDSTDDQQQQDIQAERADLLPAAEIETTEVTDPDLPSSSIKNEENRSILDKANDQQQQKTKPDDGKAEAGDKDVSEQRDNTVPNESATQRVKNLPTTKESGKSSIGAEGEEYKNKEEMLKLNAAAKGEALEPKAEDNNATRPATDVKITANHLTTEAQSAQMKPGVIREKSLDDSGTRDQITVAGERVSVVSTEPGRAEATAPIQNASSEQREDTNIDPPTQEREMTGDSGQLGATGTTRSTQGASSALSSESEESLVPHFLQMVNSMPPGKKSLRLIEMAEKEPLITPEERKSIHEHKERIYHFLGQDQGAKDA